MSKIRLVQVLILVSIVAATVALVVLSRPRQAARVGGAAPDFTLPDLKGGQVSLKDFRGRVVVLNFWATWCPPCVEEMPSLVRFARQMEPEGVTVVGVSVDYDENALRQFVEKYGVPFPVALDTQQRVPARYGTFKYPETYIIDKEGRIAEKLIGAVDWQDPRAISRVRNAATGR
jgi:cytochrome c biogenesis protein CcmG/thiol:disulfide interchange protein DsbE